MFGHRPLLSRHQCHAVVVTSFGTEEEGFVEDITWSLGHAAKSSVTVGSFGALLKISYQFLSPGHNVSKTKREAMGDNICQSPKRNDLG